MGEERRLGCAYWRAQPKDQSLLRYREAVGGATSHHALEGLARSPAIFRSRCVPLSRAGGTWLTCHDEVTKASRASEGRRSSISFRLLDSKGNKRSMSPRRKTPHTTLAKKQLTRARASAAKRRVKNEPPRDLVIGLIAPIGVNRQPIHDALFNQLRVVGYETDKVKISEDILTKFVQSANPSILNGATYLERKKTLMDAGNVVRQVIKSGDSLALLALSEIAERRDKRGDDSVGIAYIIDSLKHPSEIERLKSVYGPAFVAIGVYAPPHDRFEFIEGKRSLLRDVQRDQVSQLARRDQDEDDKLGQKIRGSFELSDVVIDVSRPDVELQIKRLIELLFGNKLKTPTSAEYGMAVARMASARSGSLARQIGAAILRDDGSVVAVGRNDVAKPHGGQYEESDDSTFPTGRDIRRGKDSSDEFRQRALADVIRLLQENGVITDSEDPEQLFGKWYMKSDDTDAPAPFLRKAVLMNTIDYIRAVHAETAALFDAARNGVSVKLCTLYTTTFPCHDCAKAIIAAGIREVVYWAPYPKSLAGDLYGDSIEIDSASPNLNKVHFHSFVGIAPNRYPDFFIMGKRERKRDDGSADTFEANKAVLTLPEYAMSMEISQLIENAEVKKVLRLLNASRDQLNEKIRTITRSTEPPSPTRRKGSAGKKT